MDDSSIYPDTAHKTDAQAQVQYIVRRGESVLNCLILLYVALRICSFGCTCCLRIVSFVSVLSIRQNNKQRCAFMCVIFAYGI